MPELPEVQTIVDDLKKRICGNRIIDIKTITKTIWRYNRPRRGSIIGAVISDVSRKGKYILIDLSIGQVLVIHLGMTGRITLVHSGAKPEKHTHVILEFTDFDLHHNDIRRFGFMDLVGAHDIGSVPYLNKLGPDPLALSEIDLVRLIKSKNRMIKPFLMDQNVISGLGNIYSDEILFRARIHPRALSSKIGKKRLINLYKASIEVLGNAIKARGSSIANYVDGSGTPGLYQNSHLVYGKEGKPCSRCGAGIRREIIGSRSAHFCPRCQRLN